TKLLLRRGLPGRSRVRHLLPAQLRDVMRLSSKLTDYRLNKGAVTDDQSRAHTFDMIYQSRSLCPETARNHLLATPIRRPTLGWMTQFIENSGSKSRHPPMARLHLHRAALFNRNIIL